LIVGAKQKPPNESEEQKRQNQLPSKYFEALGKELHFAYKYRKNGFGRQQTQRPWFEVCLKTPKQVVSPSKWLTSKRNKKEASKSQKTEKIQKLVKERPRYKI
jgi:hypothetical protein